MKPEDSTCCFLLQAWRPLASMGVHASEQQTGNLSWLWQLLPKIMQTAQKSPTVSCWQVNFASSRVWLHSLQTVLLGRSSP